MLVNDCDLIAGMVHERLQREGFKFKSGMSSDTSVIGYTEVYFQYPPIPIAEILIKTTTDSVGIELYISVKIPSGLSITPTWGWRTKLFDYRDPAVLDKIIRWLNEWFER
jgi:hypothetical protein